MADQVKDHEGKGPPTISVKVFAPNSTEPKEYAVPITEKIGELADRAAADFGYQASSPSLQTKDGRDLDRAKPLVAEHVRDGDELELVDVGGGV